MKTEFLTRELVRLSDTIDFNQLCNENKKAVLELILDGFGVLFAGINHTNVKILINYFQNNKESINSTLPIVNHTLGICNAAFINGYSIHVMDYEAMFDPPTHAVSPVLGALAALLFSDCSPGEDESELESRFLKAFIAGIQLQADLRIASIPNDEFAKLYSRFFPFQNQGFHPPGIVGVMGSALASSIFLGLTEKETCTALGMAASRASGISGNIGTMTKASHSGNAARNGLECALLSRLGFTASTRTFETPGGWAEVFGGQHFKSEQLYNGMSRLSCFNSPGFAYKKWPAHTAMQIAINCALSLDHSNDLFKGKIKITAPIFKYCDRPSPESGDDCRFSFQYNVAKVILDKDITHKSYSEEHLFKPELQNLLRNIHLELSPEIPQKFTEMWVRIELSDGREATNDRWPGHWKSPATTKEIQDKFTNCLQELSIHKKKTELLNCFNFNTLKFKTIDFKDLLMH